MEHVCTCRSQVYDICIVPIAISYDRLLEESLYAYELQGRRKPAESTSGLLKAAAILRDNYGTVTVTVAEPISVREYFSRCVDVFVAFGHLNVCFSRRTSLSRFVHALEPDVHFNLTSAEIYGIRRLGHYIIKVQQHNTRVGVWPLVCTAMTRWNEYGELIALFHLHCFPLAETIWHKNDIVKRVHCLLRLSHALGKPIHVEKSVEEDIDKALRLHGATVCTSTEGAEDFGSDN